MQTERTTGRRIYRSVSRREFLHTLGPVVAGVGASVACSRLGVQPVTSSPPPTNPPKESPTTSLTPTEAAPSSLDFRELGGFFQEGRRWLQRVLEQTEGLASIQRAHALLAAAELSSAITDFEYGLQCARQAQELFQQLGDQKGEIDARLKYCNLAGLAGKNANLEAQAKEALRMAEQISYKAGMATAMRLLETLAYNADKPEAALQYDLPSAALWRELESPFELAKALNNLGVTLLEIGEYVTARQAFLEARDAFRSLGYQRGVATAIHNLGETAQKMGEYASARELLCEALRIRHHLGLPRGYPYSFELLAQVNESEEHYEQAVQLLAASDVLRIRIGAPLEPVAPKHVTAVLARGDSFLPRVTPIEGAPP